MYRMAVGTRMVLFYLDMRLLLILFFAKNTPLLIWISYFCIVSTPDGVNADVHRAEDRR
jgi:hypothetical protein